MCIKYAASSIILAMATSGISAPQAQAFGDPVVGAAASGEFNAITYFDFAQIAPGRFKAKTSAEADTICKLLGHNNGTREGMYKTNTKNDDLEWVFCYAK
jgi:hypothetical protein